MILFIYTEFCICLKFLNCLNTSTRTFCSTCCACARTVARMNIMNPAHQYTNPTEFHASKARADAVSEEDDTKHVKTKKTTVSTF